MGTGARATEGPHLYRKDGWFYPLAWRVTDFCTTVRTSMEFAPAAVKQDAGLILYYDRTNYHYLRVSRHQEGGLRLSVVTAENNQRDQGLRVVELGLWENDPPGPIGLRMRLDDQHLYCAYSLGEGVWEESEVVFDLTILGDGSSKISSFTGTFFGICAQSLSGDEIWAHFRHLDDSTLF